MAKSNLTKFGNRYVKILVGRLYSLSLKDAVAWLERAQLIFQFSIHLSVNLA